MYSIKKLQFGVISSEFGDAKQYAEGCRQQKLTTNSDTTEQFGAKA
jgi:hypothetical protein